MAKVMSLATVHCDKCGADVPADDLVDKTLVSFDPDELAVIKNIVPEWRAFFPTKAIFCPECFAPIGWA